MNTESSKKPSGLFFAYCKAAGAVIYILSDPRMVNLIVLGFFIFGGAYVD